MALITTPTYSTESEFTSYTGLTLGAGEWDFFALQAEDILDTYVTIPDTMTPGTYKIRFTANYKVNPLRTVTIQVFTEEFEVTKDI